MLNIKNEKAFLRLYAKRGCCGSRVIHTHLKSRWRCIPAMGLRPSLPRTNTDDGNTAKICCGIPLPQRKSEILWKRCACTVENKGRINLTCTSAIDLWVSAAIIKEHFLGTSELPQNCNHQTYVFSAFGHCEHQLLVRGEESGCF